MHRQSRRHAWMLCTALVLLAACGRDPGDNGGVASEQVVPTPTSADLTQSLPPSSSTTLTATSDSGDATCEGLDLTLPESVARCALRAWIDQDGNYLAQTIGNHTLAGRMSTHWMVPPDPVPTLTHCDLKVDGEVQEEWWCHFDNDLVFFVLHTSDELYFYVGGGIWP